MLSVWWPRASLHVLSPVALCGLLPPMSRTFFISSLLDISPASIGAGRLVASCACSIPGGDLAERFPHPLVGSTFAQRQNIWWCSCCCRVKALELITRSRCCYCNQTNWLWRELCGTTIIIVYSIQATSASIDTTAIAKKKYEKS